MGRNAQPSVVLKDDFTKSLHFITEAKFLKVGCCFVEILVKDPSPVALYFTKWVEKPHPLG
jgi:hypothetical protein